MIGTTQQRLIAAIICPPSVVPLLFNLTVATFKRPSYYSRKLYCRILLFHAVSCFFTVAVK